MNQLELDESTRSLGHTLLRVVVGMVVGGHALERIAHLRAFQGELIQVGMPRPEFVAFLILVIEMAASLLLLMGRLTRVAAFAALCDALAGIAMIALQHRALELYVKLESLVLLGAASFYLFTATRDWLDARMFVRRHAAAGAGAGIEESALWQHPTLAAAPDAVVYETDQGLVYETPLESYAQPNESGVVVEGRRKVRRRWFAREIN